MLSSTNRKQRKAVKDLNDSTKLEPGIPLGYVAHQVAGLAKLDLTNKSPSRSFSRFLRIFALNFEISKDFSEIFLKLFPNN